MMPFKAMRLRAGVVGIDPYFANVVSLVHYDGSSGQTGPFADQIAARSPGWTQVAPNAILDTGVVKYGTAAVNTGTVGLYNPNHADWDFGSGDFTIEYWIYHTSLNGASGYTVHAYKGTNGGVGPWVVFNISGAVYFRVSKDGSTNAVNFNGGSISLNTWNHIAMVRQTNTVYGYVNGVSVGSGTISGGGALHVNTDPVYAGTYGASSNEALAGRMDDWRVTKAARYPNGTTFTVPAAAFPNS